jgi:hypothetical protein
MADRTGKCINFGLCSKADSREVVPVAGGEFSCPECGKPLMDVAAGAGGSSSGKSAPSGKKALAVGALGMVLVAGAAYKFLVAPDKPVDKTDNGKNIAVVDPAQNPTTPANPNGPNAPLVDPNAPAPQNPGAPPPQNPKMPVTTVPNAPMRPPAGYPPAPITRPQPRPAVTPAPDTTPVPTPVQEPEPPAPPAANGVIIARLLSPISTRNSNEGDPFQAKVENGRYRGQILGGVIKKLGKGKKNAELELEFTKLNGQAIPLKLDLTDISNSQGVKGVDDENNRIVGQSSKKKIALVTAIGAGVGAGFGRLIGKSGKATALGAAGGAGVGYLVSVKVISHAKDIELNAGSQLTLRESAR